MIEVEIENFQSIERANFEIEGFTALVGRSNIGKSATIRALKYALTGALGTDFVRHGPSCERRLKNNKKCRCQTTVRLKTPEMTMVWEKGDAVNRYTVTFAGKKAEVFDKPGSGTPDFLKPHFEPVKIGDSTDIIQVSDQFSPIFLLNQAGPTVADVLSDVARLDDINTAMRMVGKDRKAAVSTRNVREKDVGTLREELVAYDGLDRAVARAETVEKGYETIETKRKLCQRAREFVEWAENLAASLKALQAAVKPELPEFEPLQNKAEATYKVDSLLAEVLKRAPIVRGLTGIDKVELPEPAQLAERLQEAVRVDGWLGRTQTLKEAQRGLQELEKAALPESAQLAENVSRLVKAGRLLDRWSTVHTAEAELESELKEASNEEAEVLQEFEQLGVCPTCAQRIEPGHSLHQEAS